MRPLITNFGGRAKVLSVQEGEYIVKYTGPESSGKSFANMESIMRNRELTETRMMQAIKKELESVERQAEEERDAHNATKMVDRVYIGSPHMVRVFDHENRRAFLIQKEGLPDADNLLITIQEKIKWADTMSELDKKHKKENEERFEEANNVLSTSNILFILPAVTYLLFGKFVAGWHTPNTQGSSYSLDPLSDGLGAEVGTPSGIWHPDRCSASGDTKYVEEAKKKFQAVQEAYS
ncbi:hypothetical protein Tco_1084383, partial [Tanacetum coccineum]